MSNTTDEVHISSLIVQSFPEHFDSVCSHIASIDETEIAVSDASKGKIVMLIEAPSMQATTTIIDQIKFIPGVIGLSMVYHHAEPTSTLEEHLA